MSKVIDEYFNGNFHFVPPPRSFFEIKTAKFKPQNKLTLADSLTFLHQKIAEYLRLMPGKSCIDIGCGIGTVIEEFVDTGAQLTGITIAPNEVKNFLFYVNRFLFF